MAQADGTIYINTAIETDGMKKGGKAVEAAARRMAKEVSSIGASAKLALQKQADSFVRQNQLYAQQEQKIESLKTKLEEMKGQKIETSEYKNTNNEIEKLISSIKRAIKKKEELIQSGKGFQVTAEYKAAEKEVNRLEKALLDAYSHKEKFLETGGRKNSNAFKKIEYDIEKLEIQLRQATKDKEKLESSKETKTTSLKNMEKEISNLIARLVEAEKMKNQLESQGGAYKRIDTSGIESRIVNEQEKLRESGNRLGTSYEQLKQKVLDLEKVLLKQKEEEEKLNRTRNKLKAFYQNLKKKVDSYKKSSIQLNSVKKSLNKTLRNMVSLLKKGAVSILGLNKQTKKSKNNFGKALKTILKYTLGIRSMYILVNKIRNGIKEGFSNLAQYSDEINKNISALMSALTQLKNSLATAFNPILTVVTPALTKFINMISQAATYVRMFIAAMTGQKSFVKAIAVQQDYAAGLKDTAEAAEEAEKATDSYLSGLDEVKRFETKDTSDKKDKNEGYKPPTPQEMFETVPIEQSISNMVQKIKDLIKSEDWEGLGAYMASGINAGLQKVYDVINWDNVGPKITYFINAFTTTLNSLVDNIEWDLMERVIGAGINTLVNSFNLLVEGFSFENLGVKISTGLRGMLDEVEWTEFGKALGNKFMIGWRVFDGFVTDMWRKNDASLTGWSQLGISIAEALNGVVQKIDLGKIGASLGKAITGIFQVAIDFSKTFGWKEVGINIANGINNFLKNFDAKTVAVGASEVIKGILDAMIAAVENVEWGLLGEKIKEFLLNIDWGGIADRLFHLGATLISKLVDGFKQLPPVAKIVIAALVSVGGAIASLKIVVSIVKFINSLIEVFGLLTSPIGLAVIAIGSLIAIGVLLIANWDKVKKAAKETWDFVKSKFVEFDQWLQKVFSADWEYWFGIFGGVIGGFMKNVENIWGGIKGIFGGIITFLSGVFTGNWEKAWEGVKQIFKGVFDSLVAIAKSPINMIIGIINSLISAVTMGINAVISALNKINIKVPDWVPKLGGKKFGFNISKISVPRIPYLATGAVIPPNAPFLAMMGDQRNGNNLEMPEALLRKVVREESGKNQQGGGTYQFTAMINRRVLFDEMMTEAQLRMMSSGRNPFALG